MAQAMNQAQKLPDPLQPIRHQVADAVGGLMELWGFKRIMGRTWALLYLAESPLSAAELGCALQVSLGSVSMTMGELLKWGVVKKTWVPGDRRDFYLPETSVWKMVSRVIRERELSHVRETTERLTAAQQQLTELLDEADEETGHGAGHDGHDGHDGADGRDAAEPTGRAELPQLLARISALQQLGQVGQLLIEHVLSGRTIDVVGMRTALDLVGTPLSGRMAAPPADDPESTDD